MGINTGMKTSHLPLLCVKFIINKNVILIASLIVFLIFVSILFDISFLKNMFNELKKLDENDSHYTTRYESCCLLFYNCY